MNRKQSAEEIAWDKLLESDRLHKPAPDGHAITVERRTLCNFECERPVCSCGWKGEWQRIRS